MKTRKCPVRPQVGEAPRRTSGGAAPGGRVVDVARVDQRDRAKRGDSQERGDPEDRARRHGVAHQPHEGRGREVAGRVELAISPQAPPELAPPDHPERERHDGGAHHARRHAVKRLRREDERQARAKRKDDRRGGRGQEGAGEERALVARRIHPGADRDLTQHASQPAEGEREPDGACAQALRRQDDRDERPDAGLHVGQEEVQAVEAAQTPGRGHEVTRASRCGRDPSSICANVGAVPPVPALGISPARRAGPLLGTPRDPVGAAPKQVLASAPVKGDDRGNVEGL